MGKRKNIFLDDESNAILERQPRSFNFSEFVQKALKELPPIGISTDAWIGPISQKRARHSPDVDPRVSKENQV